jgi:antitoxin ParD1/3/4
LESEKEDRPAMTTISVDLPEDLKAFLDAQIAEGGYASAGEYLQAVIRDAQRREARRAGARRDLIAKLEEALAGGPAEPMTREDWESIEREAIEGLSGESIKP